MGEIIHVGQEHIDLHDLIDIGTGLLEDVGQVLDALVLLEGGGVSSSNQVNWCLLVSYSVGLNITINQLASGSVHGDSAGAVDDTISDNGLGVDTREGLGGLVGKDGGLGGHCESS